MKIDRKSPSASTVSRPIEPAATKPSTTSSSSTTPAVPRDPGQQQAARERFAATATAPLADKAPTKAPTKVTRAFVQQQAAEGVLTGKEAAKALDMGASAAQVLKWSAGETISDNAAKVLVAKDLAPLPGADPAAPFSAGGRDYSSTKDYVRSQAAEGVLTADEVRTALQRGATPEQIEAWSTGQTISDNGLAVLKLARSVEPASAKLPTKPTVPTKPLPTLPTKPASPADGFPADPPPLATPVRPDPVTPPPSLTPPPPVSPPTTSEPPAPLPPVSTRPPVPDLPVPVAPPVSTRPPVPDLPVPVAPPPPAMPPPPGPPDLPVRPAPPGPPGWVVWNDDPGDRS
jgi:hypothetical protein